MKRNVLRSILAVLAGYTTMAALVVGTTAALSRLRSASSDEEGSPTPTYTAANYQGSANRERL